MDTDTGMGMGIRGGLYNTGYTVGLRVFSLFSSGEANDG